MRKLSDEDVHEICKLICEGKYKLVEISKKFHVSKGMINKIKSGISYPEISCMYPIEYKSQVLKDEATIHRICKLLEAGCYTDEDISVLVGVPARTITRVRLGYTYRDISSQYSLPAINKIRRHLHSDVVVEICEMIKNGCPRDYIADRFNVSSSTIAKIASGKTYKQITSKYDFGKSNRVLQHGNRKLSDSDLIKIKNMIKQGHGNREISKIFNVSESLISFIRHGERHDNVTHIKEYHDGRGVYTRSKIKRKDSDNNGK